MLISGGRNGANMTAAVCSTPISLVSCQQLTQGECSHCLLAQCSSMCFMCKTGPGSVISQIYNSSSSSAGRQADGSGCEEAHLSPTGCVCVHIIVIAEHFWHKKTNLNAEKHNFWLPG